MTDKYGDNQNEQNNNKMRKKEKKKERKRRLAIMIKELDDNVRLH